MRHLDKIGRAVKALETHEHRLDKETLRAYKRLKKLNPKSGAAGTREVDHILGDLRKLHIYIKNNQAHLAGEELEHLIKDRKALLREAGEKH